MPKRSEREAIAQALLEMWRRRPPVTLADISHESFVTPSTRMGLDRSIFEPLRFIQTSANLGLERPERAVPLPWSEQVPAVAPGPALWRQSGFANRSYGQTADIPAYLASDFTGRPDPSDRDPTTGLAIHHEPSRFKTMASPTRFLTAETVKPQLAVPEDIGSRAMDTRRGLFTLGAVAPSAEIVDLYHRNAALLRGR